MKYRHSLLALALIVACATMATVPVLAAGSTKPAKRSAAIKVLYDDTHGQTAGNADWIITGAYSEMAAMLASQGFVLDSLKKVAGDGRMTPELLANYRGLILAEPNNAYQPAEQQAIVAWVKNGGGLFAIGDHGGADRDNDGYDAVKALNEFTPSFGFTFTGDFFYEAPVQGTINTAHPVMFGVRALGCWAGSTFTVAPAADAKVVSLLDARCKKLPYAVAVEFGKGRVVGLGDSSPFDDGVGSDPKNKLHDSYDSFMYSHPQFAANAVAWVTGQPCEKRVPSRTVKLANEASAEQRDKNILIDAGHGNACSDKMETFERHVTKLGYHVYYALNLFTPEMLSRFKLVMVPAPSLPYTEGETKALVDWFMAGGRLVLGCNWDSDQLAGRGTLNGLLTKLGSAVLFNSDQVWDKCHCTNKPWGMLARFIKKESPIMEGVKVAIFWGSCSLIRRDKQPLTAEAGVEILVTADDKSFNKDGDKRNDAVLYPQGALIPLMVTEKLAQGVLVAMGSCNFTDYQYPDSDINIVKPGPPPFTHETPAMMDNLVKELMK